MKTCIQFLFGDRTTWYWAGFSAATVLGVVVASPQHASAAERQILHGHVPEAVARLRLQPLGSLSPTQQLHLAIGLPLRNTNALAQLLHDLYDPAAPQFHHYLTPVQFADWFGPTSEQYEAVRQFALKHGLSVSDTFPNRLLLDVVGGAGEIEQAFQIHLRTYQHPDKSRVFFAPDTEPSVDPGLAVLAINGLDNFVLPHPMNLKQSFTAAANPAAVQTGSGPQGSFIGKDFRAAYAPGVSLTGAGQLLALLEFDGYYTNDISLYLARAGLPKVPLYNVFIDGFDGYAGYGNVEVALDIEMAISMAPGLAGILVYEAGPYGLAQDMLNHIANDDQAAQISSSWGWRPYDPNSEQIFQEFAAQGQSYFNASGDSDAYINGVVWAPMDDPYITVVGGTTLTTTGPGGEWQNETVWNWGGGIGSSGGISTTYPLPAWQQGINMTASQGSTTYRNIPDVAMVADNVFVIADGGQQEYIGGTSCATPLWAAFTALVNEQALNANTSSLGFLNPALYGLGKGIDYPYTFHDINTGNNEWYGSPTQFLAVAGYDLCTGWGTPQGQALIDALAPPDFLHIMPTGGATWMGYAGGPFNARPESFILTNAGSVSFNWSAATSASWLKLSASAGTLLPRMSTTVTVSGYLSPTNFPVGNYSAVVWFTNLADGIVQTRLFRLVVQDDLVMLPGPGVTLNRDLDHPFGTNVSIIISNAGMASMSWGLINTSVWFNLNPDSGTIRGEGFQSIPVSVTSAGASLGVGTYTNYVWFLNLESLLVETYPVILSVQPLLTNGGFETGDFSGWTIASQGGFSIESSNRFVHTGRFSASLASSGSLGFLSQTVPTMPGAQYTVSCWMLSPDGLFPNEFEIVWDGQLLYSAVNLPNRPWTNLQFLVKATAPTTTLQIGGRDDPSKLAIDDVRVTLEPLLIAPGTSLVSTGYVGGPFSSGAPSFLLANVGGNYLNWSAGCSAAWLTFANNSGTLSPGSNAVVSMAFNATVTNLAPAQYTATVWFTNSTSGAVQTRQFVLQLLPALEPLEILPANLVFTRQTGGPFSPSSITLQLTNAGIAALDWALASNFAWLNAQPATGSLSPGGSGAAVTLALDPSVATMPPANYTNRLWFTNLIDSTVQSRQVVLLTLPLIQNGGFETGDFSGWTETGDFSFCAVSTSSLYTHSGTHGASMGPSGALSYLSQTLATMPGQLYLLSCWLNSPDGLTPNEFSITWNGSKLYDRTNLPVGIWNNLKFLVTASGPSTVQFGFRNDQSYFGFDDVSVSPVATPAFQQAARAGNNMLFSWSTQPGLSYQVQYTTQLAPPNWLNLGNPIPAGSTNIVYSEPMAAGPNSLRFYRVLLLP